MTLHQIIDKVASHYNCNNRSLVEDTCRYLGADNTRCAVGMFCGTDDLSVDRLIEMDDQSCSLISLNEKFKARLGFELANVLLPEVAGAPFDFWSSLQGLHDNELAWDSSGITKDGMKHVRSLKMEFADEEAAKAIEA